MLQARARHAIMAMAVSFTLLHAPAYADPITATLIAVGVSATTAAAITSAIITAVVGTVISMGVSALAGVFSKKKAPGLSNYSFADRAGARISISRSSVESHKVIYGRVRVSGPLVYVNTTRQTVAVANVQGEVVKRNNVLHYVIPLACHEVEEIETVYLNEEALTLDGSGRATGKWVTTYPRDNGTSYHVTISKHLGSPDQAADPDLVAAFPEWTENHRLRGLAYLYCRFRYYGYNTNVGGQSLFPSGQPDISAIVKGKKVYDPRTETTAYSNNWALCLRDYLSDSDYGLGATDAEIDDDSVIAAANVCDEDVTLADASTQKRYTCDGQLDTADSPLENIKSMVTAGAGACPYAQGKFRIFAGAYTTPTAAIDETWLAGEIELQTKTPRNELFNAAKGVYVSPDKSWKPTDFPAVTNALYQTQDGGERIFRDIELPYTLDPVRAQRIAKIVLEKARQGMTVKLPCNWKALPVALWDTVTVSINRLGWNEKVFRVTGWMLTPDVTVELTLQEESSASYDWNAGEETTYDPAPDTDLPDPGTVDAPGNPTVTESLYETTDGSGVKTQAMVAWAESESPFISHYLLRYGLASDDPDETYRQEPPIYSNQHTIKDLAPGTYTFQVAAVNLRRAMSDYAETTKEIRGLSDPPEDIAGFSLNAINNQAHLVWDPIPDLDVRNGGYVRIRWSKLSSGALWSDGVDLGEKNSGIATGAVLPLLSGTYMAKAYDSTGNESVNAASIVSDIANVLAMNAIASLSEHTAFSGTKTNMVVSSGELILDGSAGAIEMSGEYVFSTYLDLGAVYTSRASIDVAAEVFDTVSNFDDADGLFDDREGLFDGGDLANTKLEFYIKTTSSDPSGTTPTDGIWSDWRKFVVGDFTARAFWAKVVVTNEKASNNVAISELTLNVDVPDRQETFNDQSIASGGTTITYAKPFYARPAVGVTVQSATSGDTVKITHVTSGGKWTGVTVQILNGGSGAGRTCDVIARGY